MEIYATLKKAKNTKEDYWTIKGWSVAPEKPESGLNTTLKNEEKPAYWHRTVLSRVEPGRADTGEPRPDPCPRPDDSILPPDRYTVHLGAPFMISMLQFDLQKIFF